MDRQELLNYLDKEINHWDKFLRKTIMSASDVENGQKAPHYIDAYKNIRSKVILMEHHESDIAAYKEKYPNFDKSLQGRKITLRRLG